MTSGPLLTKYGIECQAQQWLSGPGFCRLILIVLLPRAKPDGEVVNT